MRTKWNKLIVEHFLNGGTIINFDKHLTMADGTDLDVPAWMTRSNTSDTSIYGWILRRDSGMPYYTERHRFGTWTSVCASILITYLFPFTFDHISNMSTYSATNATSSYAYLIGGKQNLRNPESTIIMFGSGTTAPTEDDYGLESPLEKVFVTSVSGYERLNDYYAINIKNASDEEVTINEIGSFIGLTDSNQTPASLELANTNYIMLAREVLAEPITIPAGGIGQLYIK